jgi:hypothetical protein
VSAMDDRARWRELREKESREDLSDEEWREKDRLGDRLRSLQIESVPVPSCCPEAVRYQSVWTEARGEGAVWRTSTVDIDFHRVRRDVGWYEGFPEAKHCAYCGKPLPGLAKKEARPKPLRATDDGHYCSTCGDRLQECMCLPEEAGFEAK